jgi:branched-chain amino acid transport system ATP-binding protein
MLKIENLRIGYGVLEVIHGVSMHIPTGSIVTLIGANGAGKSTILRTISGLNKPRAGTIHFDEQPIHGLAAHKIVARGISQVPEGRMVFPDLTVLENLHMGAYLRKGESQQVKQDLERVFHLFPRLQERIQQQAGTLSGGEQQMLAIGRALMSAPRFLMLDEPSLGIAPLLVKAIFAKIQEINREMGLTVFLVEQNAKLALEISNYAYVLETGSIIMHGPSSQLKDEPRIRDAYLGGSVKQ